MKPLHLKISAFGPFATQIDLDFTRLTDSLFLITGATGSGKSSLFDAICYALYEQSSTKIRESSGLRSDFADPQQESYVDLEFLLSGRNYRVRRTLAYEREKMRGTGVIRVPAQAEFYCEGEQKANVPSEVNQAILDLIGLSYDQFRQTALLAQGDFVRLLRAGSSERSEIFRTLFGTEKLATLQQSLKELWDKRKNELLLKREESRLRFESLYIENQLPGVEALVADFSRREAELNELRHAGFVAAARARKEEQNWILAEAREAKRAELASLRQALATMEETKTEQAEQQLTLDRHRKAVLLAPQKQRLDSLLSDISILESEIRKLATEHEQSELDLALIEGEREERKLQAPRLREISERRTLVQAALAEPERQNGAGLLRAKKAYDESVRTASDRFDWYAEASRAGEIVQRCREKLAKTENLTQDILRLETTIDRLNSVLDHQEQIEAAARELFRLRTSFLLHEKEATEAYQNWQQTYEARGECERAFFSSQAAILAAELKNGEACPVCGSTEHPNPAKTDEKYVDKRTVEAARRMESEANQLASAKAEQVSELRGRLQQQEQKLKLEWAVKSDMPNPESAKISEADVPVDIDLDQEYEQLTQKISVTRQALSEHRAELSRDRAAIAERTQIQSEVEFKHPLALLYELHGLNNEIEKLTRQNAELDFRYEAMKLAYQGQQIKSEEKQRLRERKEQEAAEAAQQYEAALHTAGFDSAESREAVLLSAEAANALELACRKYADDYLSLKTRVEAAEAACPAEEESDSALLENRAKNAGMDRDNLTNALYQAETELARRSELITELQQFRVDEEAILEASESARELYQAASGQLSGGNRRSFEEFVQGFYFDQVLEQANRRFMAMSNDRFRLVRRREVRDARKRQGLEMDVLDRYTGKTRGVTTLSGGESFLAALALALGLSDLIQAEVGGVEINMLFLDEGFGSLDSETLEEVLKVLHDLVGGRLFCGIISHVSELKERITQQIQVERSDSGSTLKLLCE